MRKTLLSLATVTVALSALTGCMSGVSVNSPKPLFQMPEAPLATFDMGAPGGATLTFDIGPATGFQTKAGFPAQTWGQVNNIEVALVPNDATDVTNNANGDPNHVPAGPGGIPTALSNNYSAATPVTGSTFGIAGPALASFTGSAPTRTNTTMQFTNVPVSAKYRLRVRIQNGSAQEMIKANPQLGPIGPSIKFALSTNYANVDGAGTVSYLPSGTKLNVAANLDDGSTSDPILGNVSVTDGVIPGSITFNP